MMDILCRNNLNLSKTMSIFKISATARSIKRRLSDLREQYHKEKIYLKTQHNYRRDLSSLRKKVRQGEAINVLFLTNEPQKWSYNSIYKEFEGSPYFNPVIIVVPRYRVHVGTDHTRMSLQEQFDFYKKRKYHVEYGYVDGKYLDLRTFNPDIVFYLQLAEIPGIDDPYIVSKFALTAYCPYSYQFSDYRKHYLDHFHKQLFVNYMEHELTLKRFDSYKKGNSKNCVVTGYPKLDVFFDEPKDDAGKYWREPGKFKIIYAPHHAYEDENTFRWGTFKENYMFILDLARQYSKETTWVFKPHPMLYSKIVRTGFMTEEGVNSYYDEWAKIGTLYDSGDYFDIFRSSDLMITDCGSFLAEYLPTHKPLIRLINKEGIALNELGERFADCFYNSHSNEELEHLFTEIAIRRNDYIQKERSKKVDALIDPTETAAHKILNDLLRRLGVK